MVKPKLKSSAPAQVPYYQKMREALEDRNGKAAVGILYGQICSDGFESVMPTVREKFTEFADGGSPDLNFIAGCLHTIDIGVEPDYPGAMRFFDKAGEGGCTEAFCEMGCITEEGKAGAPDPFKALLYYSKAIPNSSKAMYRAASLLERGDGNNHAVELAFPLYRKAAKLNYPPALKRMGDFYLEGKFVARDEKKAFLCYRKGARSAFSVSLRQKDRGKIPKDFLRNARQLSRLHYQDHVDSLCRLADCYRYGWGVEQDQKKALYLYREAAKQGSGEAQFCVAVKYFGAKPGDEASRKRGFRWCKRSAESGFVYGKAALGICYLNGIGTDQKTGLAAKWLKEAADGGNDLSAFLLKWRLPKEPVE